MILSPFECRDDRIGPQCCSQIREDDQKPGSQLVEGVVVERLGWDFRPLSGRILDSQQTADVLLLQTRHEILPTHRYLGPQALQRRHELTTNAPAHLSVQGGQPSCRGRLNAIPRLFALKLLQILSRVAMFLRCQTEQQGSGAVGRREPAAPEIPADQIEAAKTSPQQRNGDCLQNDETRIARLRAFTTAQGMTLRAYKQTGLVPPLKLISRHAESCLP